MPRLFSQTFLALQTKISNLKFYSSALHVSTIRPWSRAAFYWTEFTFTSHEVKVNFVPKLDINQKSESKDPHWQSISSELFEKTQPLRGLLSHFQSSPSSLIPHTKPLSSIVFEPHHTELFMLLFSSINFLPLLPVSAGLPCNLLVVTPANLAASKLQILLQYINKYNFQV